MKKDLRKGVKEMKKYYAVRRGRVTGIFTTWAECKKQVEHYSNCEYAGFSTLDDALEFLGDVPDNTKPLE